MKKFIAALAVALVLCLCFAAVACAGGDVSEVGAWELEFFGDGEANYSVGDEYGGQTVTEDFYTCNFGGGKYTVEQQGETVLSGSYTAEEMADGTLCLTVGQGGEESLWTCGIRTEADGKETLCITAQVGDLTVSFVPAA